MKKGRAWQRAQSPGLHQHHCRTPSSGKGPPGTRAPHSVCAWHRCAAPRYFSGPSFSSVHHGPAPGRCPLQVRRAWWLLIHACLPEPALLFLWRCTCDHATAGWSVKTKVLKHRIDCFLLPACASDASQSSQHRVRLPGSIAGWYHASLVEEAAARKARVHCKFAGVCPATDCAVTV